MSQAVDAIYECGVQETIQHTPETALTAGKLLFFGSGLSPLVAVTLSPIAAGKLGNPAITGQFRIKKKAGETFEVGDRVAWDESPGEAVDGDVDSIGHRCGKPVPACIERAILGEEDGRCYARPAHAGRKRRDPFRILVIAGIAGLDDE